MYAIVDSNSDLIMVKTNQYDSSYIPIPAEYTDTPVEQLRYDPDTNEIIKLPDEPQDYYVDRHFILHIKQFDPSWPIVNCRWFDVVSNTSEGLKVISTIFKERVVQQVKEFRKALEESGILVNGHPQPLSSDDVSKIIGTTVSLQLYGTSTTKINWRFQDGYFASMTQDAFSTMGKFAFQYIEELFAVEKQHVLNIRKLDDSVDPTTYDYTVDWPDNTITIDGV